MWIFFFDTNQNLTSGTFLDFSCSVESETISIAFLYPATLKFIGLSFLSFWGGHYFLIRIFKKIYPGTVLLNYIGHLKILVYWVMHIFQILVYFIVRHPQNHLRSFCFPWMSSGKVFKFCKVSSSQQWIQVFPNSNFCLKT